MELVNQQSLVANTDYCVLQTSKITMYNGILFHILILTRIKQSRICLMTAIFYLQEQAQQLASPI